MSWHALINGLTTMTHAKNNPVNKQFIQLEHHIESLHIYINLVDTFSTIFGSGMSAGYSNLCLWKTSSITNTIA